MRALMTPPVTIAPEMATNIASALSSVPSQVRLGAGAAFASVSSASSAIGMLREKNSRTSPEQVPCHGFRARGACLPPHQNNELSRRQRCGKRERQKIGGGALKAVMQLTRRPTATLGSTVTRSTTPGDHDGTTQAGKTGTRGIGARARLHGHELGLWNSGRGGIDRNDPRGARCRREFLRYRGDLRSLRKREAPGARPRRTA